MKKHITMGSKTKLHDGVYINALSEKWGGYFLETMLCWDVIQELSVLVA